MRLVIGELAVAFAATGFLWPVTAIIRIISNANPTIMKAWMFFGTRPAGFGALSLIICSISRTSEFSITVPAECQPLFADDHIPVVDDLLHYVHSIAEVEVDETWLLVFEFVEGRFLDSR